MNGKLFGVIYISDGRQRATTTMSGYNTKVEFRGETYFVQTQDKGPAMPYIESLIYRSGRLLASRRKFYTEHLKDPELSVVVNRLMDEQHKQILDEILNARLA